MGRGTVVPIVEGAAGHGRFPCVMADFSGRACGSLKGTLVPAIYVFACFNTASRGWPAQGRP